MDAEVLLVLSSFCRVRMQARPVFCTASRSFVDDVGTIINHLECSRGGQSPTALAFLKVVSHVSAKAETIQEQLIGTWLLCSLLVGRMADAGNLYWECECMRRVWRLSLPVSCIGVGKLENSVLGSRSHAPEAVERQYGNFTSGSFFLNSAKGTHQTIRKLDTVVSSWATAHDELGLQTQAFDFFLPECLESKDVVVFCTRMIQKRKYFRACCVRRFDDCCEVKDLETCLAASDVRVVFVQQPIHKRLKEVFIKRNVLFFERLGRSIVDASEKALRWTVFENFSDWLLFTRARPSQRLCECWATTARQQSGLTLRLHIRRCFENLTKSIPLVQHTLCIASNEPANLEEKDEDCQVERLETGADLEALILRNSFIATLLCSCTEIGGNCGMENAAWMTNYETAMRTLDTVCQLCRLLM
ncbi:hypothetical protein LSCM1_03590 [Leishmania martiniquensis]|uniref:Uncharacterized protein n=1 Tax=Leishmania martiniquensis TaxID=1580590 RepID=A0A836H0S8_9TRYP|nr:hypothetical protein LSCM1_03590 [Leishmania martiniquensis]